MEDETMKGDGLEAETPRKLEVEEEEIEEAEDLNSDSEETE